MWELDIMYIRRGVDGWCHIFNVVGCFTRKRISYAFDANAARHVTIDSIANAVVAEKPDCTRPRMRTDNGNQYASRDFRKAVRALGIGKHEFIWKTRRNRTGTPSSSTGRSKSSTYGPVSLDPIRMPRLHLQVPLRITTTNGTHSAIGYMAPTEFAIQWELRNK